MIPPVVEADEARPIYRTQRYESQGGAVVEVKQARGGDVCLMEDKSRGNRVEMECSRAALRILEIILELTVCQKQIWEGSCRTI